MDTDVKQPNPHFSNSDHMGSFVKVGEHNVHYYEAGQGPPVLLIHGIGQSLFTWHKCIEGLSKEHHVYAVDLIGYGYSDKPTQVSYTVDSLMEFVNRFMEAIDLGKAHIVAISTGAIIALRLLEKYPYRVGRLSLLSPGGITPEMPFSVRALRSPILSWLFSLLFSRKTVQSLAQDCYFDQTQVTERIVDEYYVPFTFDGARSIFVRTLGEFDETETMRELPQIKHDVQLIWGHDDKWHRPEISEPFLISLSNSKMETIRNCGHLPHEEKPEQVLGCIIPFLREGFGISTAQQVPVSSNFGHLLRKSAPH